MTGYLTETIAGRYAEACRTPSDIFEHLPTLSGLVQDLGARKVIELGTRGGVSTVAFLYAADLVDGHVWSVDIDAAPALPSDRWTFVQGGDLEPRVVAQLPDDADIVFIDTSHAYEQTLAELNVYVWKLRPGGLFVLHDTEVRHPYGLRNQPDFPVRVALEEFCLDEGLMPEYHRNCNGLGLVRLPEAP